MKIPPIKSSRQYRAATILTISETILKKKIYLYLIGKVDRATYKTAGVCEAIQKDLISMIIEKIKKRLFLSVRTNPNIKMGKCQIEIADKEDSKVLEGSRV
eukprot:GHVR01188704.1.p1 GENE.GHVR01188704.1~~GHVR01188704.1.p1  ORF type:complete len:101 (+),score=3.33 GHVR01188704.1:158-460(+)